MSTPAEIKTLAQVEKEHILATLELLGGRRYATARALGIATRTLQMRLQSYGVPPVPPGSHSGRSEGFCKPEQE